MDGRTVTGIGPAGAAPEVLARLHELDRVRDELVAVVGHELRTPMTSIVGYVELLRSGAVGPLTPAQASALDVLRRNAERISALADDMLTWAGEPGLR